MRYKLRVYIGNTVVHDSIHLSIETAQLLARDYLTKERGHSFSIERLEGEN